MELVRTKLEPPLNRNDLVERPRLQTKLDDGAVQLALIDNGVGMDEATQARLFDVFFSTKVGGSGLGLPTVRKIVEAHQGRIACQSEPGRGTRFVISLPPAQP